VSYLKWATMDQTWTTAATSDFIFLGSATDNAPPPKPKPTPKRPETALEWLDRRVAEMRVAL
jgi:hypothetical protein